MLIQSEDSSQLLIQSTDLLRSTDNQISRLDRGCGLRNVRSRVGNVEEFGLFLPDRVPGDHRYVVAARHGEHQFNGSIYEYVRVERGQSSATTWNPGCLALKYNNADFQL